MKNSRTSDKGLSDTGLWKLGSIAVAVLFCLTVHLTDGQPVTPPPTAVGQVDIKKLDRYFDARPDDEGIGGDMTTANTSVTVEMITGKTKPELIAVFVSRDEPKDPSNAEAHWVPFQDRVTVDLGEGDGERHVFVAARWKASDTGYEGSGWGMTVRRSAPAILITEPTTRITSQPVIQLKGYSPCELNSINYDVLDQTGHQIVSGEDGSVTDSYFDKEQFAFTTNYFQCYDIELTPGTNIIVLRCSDLAGNVTTTNLVYVFSTEGDRAPPVFLSVDWPKPEALLSGGSFTARGHIDDVTAELTGQIISDGRTNRISGFPERSGYYWYEHLPLAVGENQITLTATDAAGNSACTNFVVYGVDGPELTMNPIPSKDQAKLWDDRITVTGMVKPATYEVRVNGIQAVVKPDGTWVAENVPVISPNRGGTATFEMSATPLPGTAALGAAPDGRLFTHARMGPNEMTLNPSTPACGIFQLHLTEIAGRPFVLLTSTNLTDWQPILTNKNPAATFDYADTNMTAVGCRFFRVAPVQ